MARHHPSDLPVPLFRAEACLRARLLHNSYRSQIQSNIRFFYTEIFIVFRIHKCIGLLLLFSLPLPSSFVVCFSCFFFVITEWLWRHDQGYWLQKKVRLIWAYHELTSTLPQETWHNRINVRNIWEYCYSNVGILHLQSELKKPKIYSTIT